MSYEGKYTGSYSTTGPSLNYTWAVLPDGSEVPPYEVKETEAPVNGTSVFATFEEARQALRLHFHSVADKLVTEAEANIAALPPSAVVPLYPGGGYTGHYQGDYGAPRRVLLARRMGV